MIFILGWTIGEYSENERRLFSELICCSAGGGGEGRAPGRAGGAGGVSAERAAASEEEQRGGGGAAQRRHREAAAGAGAHRAQAASGRVRRDEAEDGGGSAGEDGHARGAAGPGPGAGGERGVTGHELESPGGGAGDQRGGEGLGAACMQVSVQYSNLRNTPWDDSVAISTCNIIAEKRLKCRLKKQTNPKFKISPGEENLDLCEFSCLGCQMSTV